MPNGLGGEGRQYKQGQSRRGQKTTNDNSRERLLHLSAGAMRQGHGNEADDSDQRGR